MAASKTLTRIEYELEDDGFFDLPEPIRVAMGDPNCINVAVTRYRERIVYGVDVDLRIVQHSQN